MTKMRFCTTCQMDKPAEGFRCLSRGRGGRVKLHKCADCADRADLVGSIEARDAFGREITERNAAARSAMARHSRNKSLEG